MQSVANTTPRYIEKSRNNYTLKNIDRYRYGYLLDTARSHNQEEEEEEEEEETTMRKQTKKEERFFN